METSNGDTMLELFEDYILVGIIGFIAGAFVTRLFFKSKIQVKTIGKVIEWAMIEKGISQLGSKSTTLNQLIEDIMSSAEEVTERLTHAQDIEISVKEASTISSERTGFSEVSRFDGTPPRLSAHPSTFSEDSTSSSLERKMSSSELIDPQSRERAS